MVDKKRRIELISDNMRGFIHQNYIHSCLMSQKLSYFHQQKVHSAKADLETQKNT